MPKSSSGVFALSVAYVEALHEAIVSELWPGESESREDRFKRMLAKDWRLSRHQVADRHLLASALGRPFQTAFGEELYPTIPEKAAALFHSLISNHPFVDGNKRTAILVAEQFFVANDYWLALPSDAMYETAKQVASYRQRGIAHDVAYRDVAILFSSARPIGLLRGLVADDIFQELRKLPRQIRGHPLNRAGSQSAGS